MLVYNVNWTEVAQRGEGIDSLGLDLGRSLHVGVAPAGLVDR